MGTPNFNLPQYGADDPASLPALNAGLMDIDSQVKGLLDSLSNGGGVQPGDYAVGYDESFANSFNYSNTGTPNFTPWSNNQLAIVENGLYWIEGGFRYKNSGEHGGYSTYSKLAYTGSVERPTGTAIDGPDLYNKSLAGCVPTFVDGGAIGSFQNLVDGLGAPWASEPLNSRYKKYSGIARLYAGGLLRFEFSCNDPSNQTAVLTTYGQATNGYVLAYKVAD